MIKTLEIEGVNYYEKYRVSIRRWRYERPLYNGVLDYFMEQDLYLPYVIGVSAGACHATSYLSRQVGRSRRANLDYIDDALFVTAKLF